MRALSLFAAAMTLATATAAFAADPAPKPDDKDVVGVTLSSGIDYSSGAYGDGKDTDILVGLTNVGVTWRDLSFSASVPYLTITGPSFVVVGPGGVPVLVTPQPGSTTTGRSGWGDLNLGLTYSLPEFDDFDVAVTARTKIATADTSKGLSTGATDYSFYVDVSREFDIWGPFVNFGYRVPGKPSFYSFNDAPSFSIGTTVQLNDSLVAITSYDFDGSISGSLADAQQMFASLSWLATDDLSLTAYVEDGLSSGAPKVGTGLLVSLKVR
jgi:hypothetical protein